MQWYICNGQTDHLIETGIDLYKLPLQEKKDILCSCIYGIDIDIHAVEVAKFSLLIKLIEDETAPSVSEVVPILPDLGDNIQFGNSLVSQTELNGISGANRQMMEIAPFDWSTINIFILFLLPPTAGVCCFPPQFPPSASFQLPLPVQRGKHYSIHSSSYR